MARVRKPQPTLDSIFFNTPEQKVMRFLLGEPTSTFTPRVISSKLKGVRGLGGADGITRILGDLESIGLVEFVDNRRSVRLHDENPAVQIMKTFAAVCDLEGLKSLLGPVASKVILYGNRANGKASSDSDYELFVVSETPEEVRKIASRHPLGKLIALMSRTPDEYSQIERQQPDLAQQLNRGIVIWGSNW